MTSERRVDSDVDPDNEPKRETRVAEAGGVRVPVLLAGSAAWCWRILVVFGAFYLLGKLLGHLGLLIIPLLTALLTAALLAPVVLWLRRRGLSRGVSTLLTVVLALGIMGSIGFFVVDRAVAGYPELATQASDVVTRGQNLFKGAPFHVNSASVNNIGKSLTDQLNSHRGQVAAGVVTAGRTALDVLTGIVLWLFLTIFLLYDGDNVWAWMVGLLPERGEELARGAGHRAWRTLTGYIGGQFIVALFHGVAIGTTLLILRAPLVAPLAVLVFVGSFVPLIGAIVFGGFAVLVVLVAGGPVQALVLVIVLVIENQIEGHILQPLVVGRYVRLHPIAIAVALTAGALLAGLSGAIFAVPIVACINAAAKYLAGREDEEGRTLPPRRQRFRRPGARRPSAAVALPGTVDREAADEPTAAAVGPPETAARR